MRTLIWCLAWSLSVLVAPAAMAQDRGLGIEYTVKVADIPRQLFHVTTDIRNISQPSLDLSLPVWSPGWYVIENYAKNILRFRVTEPGGRELKPAQVRKQTSGLGSVCSTYSMGTPANSMQTFVMRWSALEARRPEAGAPRR